LQEAEFHGFVWDAEKSERCYRERGFDFDYAVRVFEGDFVEWEDERHDYREPRFVSVGAVEDQILAIVWTPRERMRRIISARRASKSERARFYGNRQAQQ
jgi:uncharacterized DUF497 family protein